MARIVLTTWGSFGDLNPYLGLALGLKARGHQPVLATAARYREVVAAAGVAFHAVAPDADPDDADLVARIMDRAKGTEVIVRELLAPAIRQAYEDLLAATEGATLLVSHPVTFAGPLVAHTRGLPWLSSVLAPISFFSPYDMPVFPPAPWLARWRDTMWLNRLLVRLARVVTARWTKPLREFRDSVGVPDRGDPVFEGQFSPHGTLALFSRVLADPQPDWPPHTRITGHIFHDGVGGPPSLDPTLARFLDAGPPPLIFTLGSAAVNAAGDFYEESARAAERLGMRAVLLVGRQGAERLPPLPRDVVAFPSSPYSQLLPRGAATVHSGGIGSTAQALRAGVPMLVVPYAHDQPDNAARVVRLGVARTVPPARYDADTAARLLGALLRDADVVARARAVGERVRAEDGVAAACDAIEALLRDPVRDRGSTH